MEEEGCYNGGGGGGVVQMGRKKLQSLGATHTQNPASDLRYACISTGTIRNEAFKKFFGNLFQHTIWLFWNQTKYFV